METNSHQRFKIPNKKMYVKTSNRTEKTIFQRAGIDKKQTFQNCGNSGLPPANCGDVEHIIAPDKGIPVLVLQLSVGILFCLFQSNVHVAIKAGQHPSVVHPRVQLDHNWSPNDLFEEVVRVLP